MALALELRADAPADADALAALAEAVLQAELGAAPLVCLTLVDDATIAELNRTWLQHSGPTDVLTFPLADAADPATGAGPVDTPFGEIVVSVDTAARQAADYGWSLADELRLLLVHGLLHLCGWDDQTPAERDAMQRREDDLLQAAGYAPAPREADR